MEIEYASVLLGFVSIGLFFLGFFFGKQSGKQETPEKFDLSNEVNLEPKPLTEMK